MAEKPLSSGQKWFLRWVFPGFGGYFALQGAFVFSFQWSEVPFPRYRDSYVLHKIARITSDHRNEKTKTLCNTKYTPKPKKTHLRNHFWPLESGFSAIATYKTNIFSKSCNVPILNFFLVIPDTFSIPKSLTELMGDLIFLKTRSRPMWPVIATHPLGH